MSNINDPLKNNGKNNKDSSLDKISYSANSSFMNNTNNQQPSSLPSLSLPKGGGAIRGIGEKFSVNPVTGTGSLTVPIYTSPGRSGFGPSLSISYDSGSGNGPFGFGWNLSIPSITRKTDKGLPRYQDPDESDVYILSGAEDLVPVMIQTNNGQWQRESQLRTVNGKTYSIQRYRPRMEGLFSRIERWINMQTGEIHWRSISKDNITTVYGKAIESRIADPSDQLRRIFSWLICESYDDKGNAIRYEYKAENSLVDSSFISEKNRTGTSQTSNRYIKRIKYGNRTPYLSNNQDLSSIDDWMFEVIFDYGEHYFEVEQNHPATSVYNPIHQWDIRQDAFSSYRAGFEVRTYRLCHRVLMFHHFQELGEASYLVRSTDFSYAQSPVASFITAITQSGYKLINDHKYLKKSLPPLEFGYSQSIIKDEIQEIEPPSLENLPVGLDGKQYQWVDLDGEGLAGILTEQAGAWYYKNNLSSLPITEADGKPVTVARFAALESKSPIPSFYNLNNTSGRQQLMDLAGDGKLDLTRFDNFISGYFKRSSSSSISNSEDWQTFTPFSSIPNISWDDPNLRFIDLTGDGHADILITEDQAFTWYSSLAEKGFGESSKKVIQVLDEEKGPRLVFSDITQSIYLADMSGDGLTDILRIRNGEVCYWPNIGYGHFGQKVTMDNSPWFDIQDQFDQRRIRIADIDGSGTSDIIYLGRDGIHLYFNQSGNGLSEAQVLNTQFPNVDELSSVMAVDLLGNNTTCLVWSSSLPEYSNNNNREMRYIDFMGGQKPHLLVSIINNMGAETKLQYAPSTKFYLADKMAGKPWITKLPFPVQVVERVETYDRISRNYFVTRYAYHHGYFDGVEREFRGFGLVEQWDTEEFAVLNISDAFPFEATNIEQSSHVPPVLTKTWFHTGAYLDDISISTQFKHEYYPSIISDIEFDRQLLPNSIILQPERLTVDEVREAHRALKGSVLRQEVYALDNLPNKSEHPYTVSDHNYSIKRIQPQDGNNTDGNTKHGVFFVHPRETIDYHYERNPGDPRVSHSFTLEVDDFGNVKKSATVAYGRRIVSEDPELTDEEKSKQTKIFINVSEIDYTIPILEQDDSYRTPLQCETRTFEVTGILNENNARADLETKRHFDYTTMYEVIVRGNAELIEYYDTPNLDRLQKRLIKRVRTLYRKDDLTAKLPLGEIESRALPFETYKLAFRSGLRSGLNRIYADPVTDTMLRGDGKYFRFQDDDASWWVPSGKIFYSPNSQNTPEEELDFAIPHFFLPHRFHDPFDNISKVSYDINNLLLKETQDALANVISVDLDYRVLQPMTITDPNRNRSKVAFDTLGLVVGTAVMGKIEGEENKGDSLGHEFEADLDDNIISQHILDPFQRPHDILKKATTRLVYDLFQYKRSTNNIGNNHSHPRPNVVYTLTRETHESDLALGGQTKIQHSFSYSDGFGRVIQNKIQAEPGDVEDTSADHRWIGSGWTILNNKGKPVKKYQPFFSDIHEFQFAKTVGVSPTLFYDPLGRTVATLHPNHTYEKIVFDAWRQETWDVNDNVLQDDPTNDPHVGNFFSRLSDRGEYHPSWHNVQIDGRDPSERQAAIKTEEHSGTPTIRHFDSLGRAFLTISNNGNAGKYHTNIELDIEGNQKSVKDALGRKVMIYDYDMLGTIIHQSSMEAGQRWILNDISGKKIYNWDSRGHRIRSSYDRLRRPIEIFLLQNNDFEEKKIERIVYGDRIDGDRIRSISHNLLGKIFQHFDQAGIIINEDYDFKGNLLASTRQILRDYRTQVDWNQNPQPQLEAEVFKSSTIYDALNRAIQQVLPHSSRNGVKINIIRPSFNEANLLESVDVWLERNAEPTELLDTGTATRHIVTNIDYNEKGQRILIEYGNGVKTQYEYDSKTFRLIHLFTTRRGERFRPDCPNPTNVPCGVQNLHYTYDPVGNVTTIRDDAQQRVFFDRELVTPNFEYNYDPVYRLVEANGREHRGQISQPETSWDDSFRIGLAHPHDGQKMRNYSEIFTYDEAGNILRLEHVANEGVWNRTYSYNEDSLIEGNKKSNRLSSTTVRRITDSYKYDLNGNMVRMPHLTPYNGLSPNLHWDFEDQLKTVDLGGGGTLYYVNGDDGQRIRKVHEHIGSLIDERIYFGNYEVYRTRNQAGFVFERETVHITDDKQTIALVETRTIDTRNSDRAPRQLLRYQHGNHLGSACLELDEQANIISYEEYYPYGSTSYQAVRSQTEVPKRYRFTGKERDKETGLNYHGARYYIPWLGRWTNCDPVGIGDAVNLYQYSLQNPIRFVDLSGRQTQQWSHGVPGSSAVRPPSGGGGGVEFQGTQWRPTGWSQLPSTSTPPPSTSTPPSTSRWLEMVGFVGSAVGIVALTVGLAVVLFPSSIAPEPPPPYMTRAQRPPDPISAPPPHPSSAAIDPGREVPAQLPGRGPPSRVYDPRTYPPVLDPRPFLPVEAGRSGPDPQIPNLRERQEELETATHSVHGQLLAERSHFRPGYGANILVGGGYAEIAGSPQRVITVSHPNAYDVLNSGLITLPTGFQLVGSRPPAGRALPLPMHVERVAAAEINWRAARTPGASPVAGLVYTSSPACPHCARVWANRILFPLWQHLNF